MTYSDSRARFWRFALVTLGMFWLITAIIVIRMVSGDSPAPGWNSGLAAERQSGVQAQDASALGSVRT